MLQDGILHLHQMGREFDIIESTGVLHHMHDPMAGWRVLVDLLKPGGFHLMFSDINEELKNKKYLYIKLNFKENGSIEIPFQIKKNNTKGHVNYKH